MAISKTGKTLIGYNVKKWSIFNFKNQVLIFGFCHQV